MLTRHSTFAMCLPNILKMLPDIWTLPFCWVIKFFKNIQTMVNKGQFLYIFFVFAPEHSTFLDKIFFSNSFVNFVCICHLIHIQYEGIFYYVVLILMSRLTFMSFFIYHFILYLNFMLYHSYQKIIYSTSEIIVFIRETK